MPPAAFTALELVGPMQKSVARVGCGTPFSSGGSVTPTGKFNVYNTTHDIY
jgi:hypothetical protein